MLVVWEEGVQLRVVSPCEEGEQVVAGWRMVLKQSREGVDVGIEDPKGKVVVISSGVCLIAVTRCRIPANARSGVGWLRRSLMLRAGILNCSSER